MRLAQPFYRLPVLFDDQRLRTEIAALPAESSRTMRSTA